jgi:hypothetical protein
MTRIRASAIALGCVAAAVVAVRAATFDPAAYARSVQAQMSAFGDADPGALRSIANASTPAQVMAGVDRIDVPDLEKRVAAVQQTLRDLRARFHQGDGPCARYPSEDDLRSADADAVARDLVEAKLAPHLSEALSACSLWQSEQDAGHHAQDVAAEAVAYFSTKADPWTRLGVVLRRDATRDAMEALVRGRAAPELSETIADPARALCQRYGSLVAGSMLVARRKGRVDLGAPEMHLLSPGMTAGDVRDRLGDPSTSGTEWRYGDLGAVIGFGPDGRVVRIRTGVEGWRPLVIAGDRPIVGRDRTTIVDALGPPSATGDEDARVACDADEVLLYRRGAFEQALCFLGGRLHTVELRGGDEAPGE